MRNLQKTLLAHYQYDALDRLTVHGQADRRESQRFYCGSRLVTEIRGGERHSIFQHGDQLLAQQTQDSGGRASTLLATDLQRSVLNVLDENDTPVCAYSPYGHRPFENGLTSLLGFNGQRPDPVTGHYLLGNGYRAFNPVLMRFTSPDSWSPFDEGGLNAYAYCQGDPVNRIDPTGHRFHGVIQLPSNVAGDVLRRVKIPLKPVDIHWLGDHIHLIEDVYHGKARLTVRSHGKPGYLKAWRAIGPTELYSMISKSSVNLDNYSNIRLVMCHGADKPVSFNGNSTSFAQRFADISGLPVKAYKGKVTALHEMFLDKAVIEKYGAKYFGVAKSRKTSDLPKHNYSPAYFQPKASEGSKQNAKVVSEIRAHK